MIIQAPDNKTIDFGDMPPDQVQAAMQNLYPPQQPVSPFNTATDSMKNAASFGMGSPIEGLANAAATKLKGYISGQSTPDFGTLYDQGRQQYTEKLANSQKQNPTASSIGTVLGALGSIPSSGIAETAPSFLGKLKNYVTRNTLPGAALGAMSGFGNTTGDISKQGQGALLGGVAGGALGSILPPVLGAGGSILSRIVQNPEQMQSMAGDLAGENISKALSRDNLSVGDIPVDQNLLQAGGKGVTARAEAIATRGGEGGDILSNYAVNQKAGLPTDLSEALGKNFQESNYPALLDAIKLKAKTEAGPAYDAAYNAAPKINDPQINQALDRAVAAGDWPVLTSEARKLAAYEGNDLGNIDATGTIRSFSTKDLDYMTRALRNLGQGTEGMGAMGNFTPLGGMRASTAGAIRDRLKVINPAFGDATSQYAGDIAMHDAAQAGKQTNLFGMGWKQAVNDYQKLSPAEQNAWRIGQAENLQTMIANNPSAMLTRMNSPQFSKVMNNFYSPSEYSALMGNVQQLAKQRAQIGQITGNSRTMTRAMQQAADKEDDPYLAESVIRKGPYDTAKDFVTDQLVNRVLNTPVRQSADRMTAQALTSSPFQLASQSTGGFMNPSVESALTGQTSQQTSPYLNQILQGQSPNIRGMYQAPLINYIMSGNQQ